MRPQSRGALSFIVCLIFTVSLAASASAEDGLLVVASSINGDANYMISNGDGTFSPQNILQLTSNSGISLPFKYTYGCGLGDFDNDGDLDYIMGMGLGGYGAEIYIYENTGSDYQFEKPVYAASWEQLGTFPADIAVADFDEDGNADFVMALINSSDTMLYLGDGALGFRSYIVPSSAPVYSYGIDTADFNNDGHADFVVAPASPGQFFVNLGKGDGTFDTFNVNTYDGGAVYGLAAADFDGDGNADIAAAYHDYLYIYKGAGDGMTFEFLGGYEFELNLSALDNYDFNGDGKQDLVAADYGSQHAGVVVLLGRGDGTFTFDDIIYLGGSSMARNGIATPPYEPNREPVAVIDPAYMEATVGEEIVFDGSYSYDADGEIVAYEWNFGDENGVDDLESLTPAEGGGKAQEVSSTHIYYKSGTYTVSLTVTDNKGAKNVIQSEVNVKPLMVMVKFSPHTLDLKSRDKWILATIQMPDGLDVGQIDRSSLSVATETSAPIPAHQEYKRGFLAKLWYKIQRRMNVATFKFDRQAVVAAIGGPSEGTALTVRGKVLHKGGLLEFSGSGQVKTFEKSKHWNWGFFSKHSTKTSHHHDKHSARR